MTTEAPVTSQYEQYLKVGQEVQRYSGSSKGMVGGFEIKFVGTKCLLEDVNDRSIVLQIDAEKIYKWNTPVVAGKTRFKIGENEFSVIKYEGTKVTLQGDGVTNELEYLTLMSRNECVMLPPENTDNINVATRSDVSPFDISTDPGVEVKAAKLNPEFGFHIESNLAVPHTRAIVKNFGIALIEGVDALKDRSIELKIVNDSAYYDMNNVTTELTAAQALEKMNSNLLNNPNAGPVSAVIGRTIVDPEGNVRVITAHLGNTRTLVVRGDRIIELSRDHTSGLAEMDISSALLIQRKLGNFEDSYRLDEQARAIHNRRYEVKRLGDRVNSSTQSIETASFRVQKDDVIIFATGDIKNLSYDEILKIVRERARLNAVQLSQRIATQAQAAKNKIYKDTKEEVDLQTSLNVRDKADYEMRLRDRLARTRFINQGGVAVGVILVNEKA